MKCNKGFLRGSIKMSEQKSWLFGLYWEFSSGMLLPRFFFAGIIMPGFYFRIPWKIKLSSEGKKGPWL